MRGPRQAVHTPESRRYRQSATPGGCQPVGIESLIHRRLALGSGTAHRSRDQPK